MSEKISMEGFLAPEKILVERFLAAARNRDGFLAPQKITIKNKSEMAALAKEIATLTHIGDVIGLKGSLGVGKSFFAREFVNALSANKINVPSPTFNLVYSYATKKGEVFHFDLYRLKNAEELENIGFFDALQSGICLIEWPEIAQKFLPKSYIEIEILNFGEGEARQVILSAT